MVRALLIGSIRLATELSNKTFEQNFRTQVPNSSFKLGNNAERFLMETAWSLKQQKAILNFRILDFHNVHFLFLLSFTFTRSVPLVTGSFGLTKLNESPDGRHNMMTFGKWYLANIICRYYWPGYLEILVETIVDCYRQRIACALAASTLTKRAIGISN